MKEVVQVNEFKRHIKDIENHVQNIDLLGMNPELSYLYKKTKKLSTALYLITEHFVFNESLRWEMRSVSMKLMSFVTSVAEFSESGAPPLRPREGQNILNHILSLLEISFYVKLVSPMNYSILRDEFCDLAVYFQKYIKDAYHDEDLFPHQFFAAPKHGERGQARSVKDTYKRHHQPRPHQDKGQSVLNKTHIDMSLKTIEQDSKIYNNRTEHVKDKNNQPDISKRQNVILHIVRTRGEVSIKDISSIIKDCSEKTVQRDLIFLMQKGVIERRGARRWSMYRMKDGPTKS